MKITLKMFIVLMGLITVLFTVGCSQKRIEISSTLLDEIPESETQNMNRITENADRDIEWSQEKADQFYDVLKSKMYKVGFESNRKDVILQHLTFKEFKAYLLSQGIEEPEGFDIKLPQLSKEELEKILDSSLSGVKKNQNNNYVMDESTERAFQPVLQPYTYLKCSWPDGSCVNFYFHDTYMSILYPELDYSNLNSEKYPELYPEDKIWIIYDDLPAEFWWPMEGGLANCKYELVNCKTNESAKYSPLENETERQVEKKVDAMFMDAKQQSEEVNLEIRKKMIFDSVKSIIDNTGSNVETAKMIYEDLCWTAWKDIKSVSEFNKDARTLTFFDFDGKAYTGYLNKNKNLWKVINQNGEIIYQGTPNDSRKMSLADLAVQ